MKKLTVHCKNGLLKLKDVYFKSAKIDGERQTLQGISFPLGTVGEWSPSSC